MAVIFLCSGLALQLVISAEGAQLETRIHKGVHDGAVRGPDDPDALVVQMYTLHEGGFSGHADQDPTSAGKRLFCQVPLYPTNYLFARLVAVKLSAVSAEDPGFAARYARVQARGFDREPGEVVEGLRRLGPTRRRRRPLPCTRSRAEPPRPCPTAPSQARRRGLNNLRRISKHPTTTQAPCD